MIHGLGEPCGLLGDASSSCTWWRLPLRTHYKRPPEILRTVPEKRAKRLSHDCPERQSAACTPYWRLTSLRRKLSSRRRSSEQKKKVNLDSSSTSIAITTSYITLPFCSFRPSQILLRFFLHTHHLLYYSSAPTKFFLYFFLPAERTSASSLTMLDQMANEIKLISGSSHPELSALVANRYV